MSEADLSMSKKDRQAVRVRDMVRLRTTLIDPDVRQEMLDRIALERLTTGLDEPVFHSQRMEEDMQVRERLPNSTLMNRLATIEAKLDALLTFLTERDLEERWGPLLPVNISASGLLFPHDREFESGALLRVELLMQTIPSHPIVTVAEVMRTRDPDPAWGTELPFRLAVRFLDVDPEDRDRIVHRVFEVQRMFLRRAKDTGEAAPDMTHDSPDALKEGK